MTFTSHAPFQQHSAPELGHTAALSDPTAQQAAAATAQLSQEQQHDDDGVQEIIDYLNVDNCIHSIVNSIHSQMTQSSQLTHALNQSASRIAALSGNGAGVAAAEKVDSAVSHSAVEVNSAEAVEVQACLVDVKVSEVVVTAVVDASIAITETIAVDAVEEPVETKNELEPQVLDSVEIAPVKPEKIEEAPVEFINTFEEPVETKNVPKPQVLDCVEVMQVTPEKIAEAPVEFINTFPLDAKLASAYMSQNPGVHFDGWWIRKVSNSTSLLVEGQRFIVSSENEVSTQLWHSSVIVDLIEARCCQSSSGNKYYLHGELDVEAMERNGFSAETIDAFIDGFPVDWRSALSPSPLEPGTKKRKSVDAKHEKLREEVVDTVDESSDSDSEKQIRIDDAKQSNKRRLSLEDEDDETRPKKRGSMPKKKLVRQRVEASDKQSKVESPAAAPPTRSTRRNSDASISVKLEWGTSRVTVKKSQVDEETGIEKDELITIDVDPSKRRQSRGKKPLGRPKKHPDLKKPVKSSVMSSHLKEVLESSTSSRNSRLSDEHIVADVDAAVTKLVEPFVESRKSIAIPTPQTAVISNPGPGNWSSQEDALLNSLIWKFDPNSKRYWKKVSEKVPGRTADECKERYQSDFGKTPTLARRYQPKSIGLLDAAAEKESNVVADVFAVPKEIPKITRGPNKRSLSKIGSRIEKLLAVIDEARDSEHDDDFES